MPTMSMSASGGKADIPDTSHQCQLLTQSGHFEPGRTHSRSIFDHCQKIAVSSKRMMNGEPKSPRIPALGLAQAVISVRAVGAQARSIGL
jgi:hypothetical protein